MARYHYRANRTESQRLQIAAHKANRLLLKPATGVTVAQLTIVSQGRMERIATWVRQYGDYAQLDIALSDILSRLVFGTKAEKFEQALDELSRALGFAAERPEKEWKEGPDNLWALDDSQYILWECKSEVEVQRAEINKRESEQMRRLQRLGPRSVLAAAPNSTYQIPPPLRTVRTPMPDPGSDQKPEAGWRENLGRAVGIGLVLLAPFAGLTLPIPAGKGRAI